MSGEIVHTDEQLRELTVINRIDDKDLRSVAQSDDPFAAALALAAELYGDVQDVTQELGNGFTLVEKDALEGEHMVLMYWVFNEGDFGEFASIAAVTASQKRVIFNDGSTGVFAQLKEYTQETKRNGGLLAPKGLRANEYPTCKECGKAMPRNLSECKNCGNASDARSSATTYYIDLTSE